MTRCQNKPIAFHRFASGYKWCAEHVPSNVNGWPVGESNIIRSISGQCSHGKD